MYVFVLNRNKLYIYYSLPGLCLVFGPGTIVSASAPPFKNNAATEASCCRNTFSNGKRHAFVIVSQETINKSVLILKNESNIIYRIDIYENDVKTYLSWICFRESAVPKSESDGIVAKSNFNLSGVFSRAC